MLGLNRAKSDTLSQEKSEEQSLPKSSSPESTPKRLNRKQQRNAIKTLEQRKRAVEAENKKAKKSIKAQLAARDKELTAQTEGARKKRAAAKDVYNSIGFNLMFEDGTCEVEQGLWSQTIGFSDISYQSARPEDQKDMFNLWSQVFDYCGSETCIQECIINTPISQTAIGHREFFPTNDPVTAEYAAEYNRILNTKMREGVSNLTRERYLTFSVGADSYEDALPRLARMRSDLMAALAKLGCIVRQCSGQERLEVIASQLRPEKPFYFDYPELIETGLTTKDAICPSTLNFRPDGLNSCFKSDDKWCQVLVFRQFGSQLCDNALSEIIDLSMPLNVTLHTQALDKAKANDFVKNRLMWIDKEIIENQQTAVKKGFDYQLIPQELAYSKAEGEELLNELQHQNQRLFIFTGLVYTYADTPEDLNEQVIQIISTARRNSIEIDVLECQQKQGMNSILPLGHNHMGVSRFLTTAQVAMLIPFATQELNQKGGGYYGQNKVSSNLILMNRKSLPSPMGFVFGTPGSGKSFAVKREITNTFLQNPTDEFIIIDPAGEYPPLVEGLGGQTVRLAPNSPDRINIMDTFAGGYSITGEDPTTFKSESILAIASEIMKAGENGITPEEKTLIDRSVRLTYEKFEDSIKPPTLGDFYEVLKEQPEPEKQRLVMGFELYITGGLNYFNHASTVNLNSRIVTFSYRELGNNMKVFALLVMLDFAYNRMLYNFERGITTWLYVDEIQSAFTIPAVVKYLDRFYAEARKYNMIVTGITQTAQRILQHDLAKHLLNNSDFTLLLKQSDQDRIALSSLLGLSKQQESYLDRTINPGEGLLIAGAAFVPFKDDFPEGKLYDLWNTKPEEIAEKKAAAWQVLQDAKQEEMASTAQNDATESNLSGVTDVSSTDTPDNSENSATVVPATDMSVSLDSLGIESVIFNLLVSKGITTIDNLTNWNEETLYSEKVLDVQQIVSLEVALAKAGFPDLLKIGDEA